MYKYTCVFCGTETNNDYCECCKSFDGLVLNDDLELEEIVLLDKMLYEEFDKLIEKYENEKALLLQTNKFYNSLLDKSPQLKYILITWIKLNVDKIYEIDISIDYLSQEKNKKVLKS